MTTLLRALDVLPGWLWALLCAGAISSLAVTGYQLKAERQAHQSTKTDHAQAIAQAMTERALEEAQRRKAEQDLIDAQETHAQEVAAIHVARDRDRAAGAAVAVRLRDAGRATATLAGAICADTATAELRQAASAAAGMLAELRERADERAGILAAFAADAHLAGLACQRRYDEARQALKD